MAETPKSGMMWLDYLIFISILVVSLVVGLFQAFTGGKQKTIKEYLVANRKLKVIPTGMSAFISWITSVYILGVTAEMYLYGSQLWTAVLGSCVAIFISTFVVIPVVYPLQMVSVLEYYKLRYDSVLLRKIAVTSNIIMSIMGTGLNLYATATAIESVSGLSLWTLILITGLLAITYTSLGGMLAVIWTDVVQGTTVILGMIAVAIMAIVKVGGFSEVWRLAGDGDRLIFLNTNPDPTERQTFWTCLFGTPFSHFFMVLSSQAYLQRICSVQSELKAKVIMYMVIPSYLILHSLLCFLGLTIYAYYRQVGCDPLRSGQISNSNQLLPYFIVDGLGYPGVTGLIIAIIFCASLSSLSTTLNGVSAILWKEIFEHLSRKLKEIHRTVITKCVVVVFGGLGIGMAFVLPLLPGHVNQIAHGLLGGLSAPISAVLVLGIVFRCANRKGALCGLVISMALTSWITIGQNVTNPHRKYMFTEVDNCSANATIESIPTDPEGILWPYRLSYQYLSVVGMFSTVLFGLLFSMIFGGQDPNLDQKTCINLCGRQDDPPIPNKVTDGKDEKGIEILPIEKYNKGIYQNIEGEVKNEKNPYEGTRM